MTFFLLISIEMKEKNSEYIMNKNKRTNKCCFLKKINIWRQFLLVAWGITTVSKLDLGCSHTMPNQLWQCNCHTAGPPKWQTQPTRWQTHKVAKWWWPLVTPLHRQLKFCLRAKSWRIFAIRFPLNSFQQHCTDIAPLKLHSIVSE